MNPLSCKVENFGSWKNLEFDFNNLGLALVHGSTGSGKSTLLDLIPWCLFGVTAKGGSVEEVRSWQASGDATTVQTTLECQGRILRVTRIRGGQGKNDLFWTENDETKQIRGKDLNDTQKLLETRLTVSADSFIDSSYYHEFSSTAAFFTSKSKERRNLFERVRDLSFSVRLAERCVQEKRVSRDSIKIYQSSFDKLSGSLDSLHKQHRDAEASSGAWEAARLRAVSTFTAKAAAFEEEKIKKIKDLEEKSKDWEQKALDKVNVLATRLQELEIFIKPAKDLELEEAKIRNQSRCSSCGALPENVSQLLEKVVSEKFSNNNYINELKTSKKHLKELGNAVNPYEGTLQAALQEVNSYYGKARDAESQENPFTAQLCASEKALSETKKQSQALSKSLSTLQHRYDSLSHLYDLSFELRGELINTVIQDIQDETNRILETYFDAELRVGFQSKDADNLEVHIQKSGYDCSYTQLSKGQRQLLRLSFSLAVMKSTANNSGAHFDTIMIDEGLDGLDTELKLKAFRLLQEVSNEHSSVLVIDHSPDLATLFENKYHVTLNGDYSHLES